MADDKEQRKTGEAEATAGVPAPATLRRWILPGTASLTILATLGLIYSLYFASSLLLPIFLAFFLTILLRPSVDQLRRLRVPEALGAVVVIVALLICGGIVMFLLTGPLETWSDRLPLLMPEIQAKLSGLRESLEQAQQVTEEIEKVASLEGDNGASATMSGPGLLERAVGGITDFMITSLATLVLLYFFLANGRKTTFAMLQSIKDPEEHKRWSTIIEQTQREIGTYLQTVTVINLALGVATAAAMLLLGMPDPLLWGVMAALLNFLPYIGSLVMTATLAVVGLVTFDSWFEMLLPAVCYMLINGAEGQFITPFILGRRLTLNPIAVFLSLLFWGWLWGMVGALLSVPILVLLRVLARHIGSVKFLRPLLR